MDEHLSWSISEDSIRDHANVVMRRIYQSFADDANEVNK